ncbi:hypothetical protein AT726_10670 [Turicibacter sp. H121]|nr:hypothetical protein AT726_10670 [Turicibacter sp. H121]
MMDTSLTGLIEKAIFQSSREVSKTAIKYKGNTPRMSSAYTIRLSGAYTIRGQTYIRSEE